MRSFFILACLVITFSGNAQQVTLMNEGTRLEYQSYIPKTNLLGKHKGYHTSVRLIYTVNAVRDSGSNKVSYITKEGISFKNAKRDTYKKQIVLASNDKLFRIPFDLFNADTSFLADLYPALKKRGFFVAHAALDQPVHVYIPHELDNVRELSTDKSTCRFEITLHDFMPDEMANRRASTGPVFKDPSMDFGQKTVLGRLKEEVEIRINKAAVNGKQNITTPAGSFSCYKIVLYADMVAMRKSHPVRFILWYDPAIGCIRFEGDGPMNTSGYVELTKIGG